MCFYVNWQLEDPMESLAAFKKFDRNGWVVLLQLVIYFTCEQILNQCYLSPFQIVIDNIMPEGYQYGWWVVWMVFQLGQRQHANIVSLEPHCASSVALVSFHDFSDMNRAIGAGMIRKSRRRCGNLLLGTWLPEMLTSLLHVFTFVLTWMMMNKFCTGKIFFYFYFMPEVENDPSDSSYEIQLTKDVRRKGLGKFLMQILELLAYKSVVWPFFPLCIKNGSLWWLPILSMSIRHSMCKVMLTIFKHNSDAQNFFLKKLKLVCLLPQLNSFLIDLSIPSYFITFCLRRYQLDESNPEATVAEAMFSETEAYCYQIISKATQLKKLKSWPTFSFHSSSCAFI